MAETLCVVIPVYNEEAAIGNVLEKWTRALDALGVDYRIRPYNDGSKDSSLSVMRKFASSHSRVEVRDKANGGHGNTVLTGYREAAADGFDWVFQVDSDDEMGPEGFAELWNVRHDFDFLLGRRGGRTQSLPRKAVSMVSRLAVRLFYGRGVWDVNSPYRLMRTSAFAPFYGMIPLTTFAPNVMLSGLAAREGLRMFEVAVPQRDRTTGEVSIRKWRLFKAAVRSFRQTLLFALRGREFWLPLAPALAALASIDSLTFIWYDELCMGDGVFMKALHGLSWSGVWACSYNPLYPMLMVAWTKLFGASHFAFCSFSVLCGYLSCLALLRIAHRRRLFSSGAADCAFTALFWGGWQFSVALTCGRVDVLMLLLTALFVDALTPSKVDRIAKPPVAATAFAMMLAAPYTLPIMFFYGLMLLVLSRDRTSRLEVVRRGFSAAVGIVLAFGVNCLYYLVQNDLIRFLGSYVYFNTHTGYRVPGTFVGRLATVYGYDLTALVLCGLGLAIGRYRRGELAFACFTALVPVLMVLGGRYEIYYSWVFFIPSLIMAITAANRRGRTVCRLLAGAGLALLTVHPLVTCRTIGEARENRDRCRLYVEKVARWIEPETDVVVASDLDGNTGFYYPLVKTGARIWYRGEEMLNGRTDEEKFSEGLAFVAGTPERKRQLHAFIAKVQRFIPILPEKGFVIFYSDSDVARLKPLYEKHRCSLEKVDGEGEFSLWRFERAPEAEDAGS